MKGKSGEAAITAQQIADFDEILREDREQLTIFTHPLKTFQVFALGAAYLTRRVVLEGTAHPAFLCVILPLSPIWYFARTFPGPHSIYVRQIEFFVEFFVWWVGLGIMSSIGLGSGLQSGVLFLFPHIIKTCLAAQTCQTLDFESSSNMWFRKPKALFKCPPLTPNSTPVTFLGLWLKVLGVCFLQTAGTALGEIPPFWMTRAARLAAIEAGTSSIHDDVDVPEELEAKSHFHFINRTKAWIVRFLRKHGFYGILTMASIPNPLFDMCGICCGHYLMPFSTFFSATFLGKAVIRNFYQSLMYVALCGEEYMQMVIRILQHLAPDSWQIDEVIREIIEDGQASFRNIERAKKGSEQASTSATALLFYWQCFMGTLLFLFLLSCISQFAQFYQLTLDQAESNKLRARLPAKVRESLLSPGGSGRLILPPPTPKTGLRGGLRVGEGMMSTVRQVPAQAQAQSTLKPVAEDAENYDCHDALASAQGASPMKSSPR